MTDNMAVAFDKINSNFTAVDDMALGHPKEVWNDFAWGISPGQLVDSRGLAPATFTRASTAYSFNQNGYVVTSGSGVTRLVPGRFGSRAAIKVEGTSTNLFTQSVIKDTSLDGLADNWTALGLAGDRLLTVESADIGSGQEQVVLTEDAAQATGVEHFTTASINHLHKTYVVSAIVKITQGTPDAFKAVMHGYNVTSDLIYVIEIPMSKWQDCGTNSGYAIYTATVSTPDVTDFGNQTGWESDTMATVAVGIRVASTTTFQAHIWHVQLQEKVLTSPIRTDGTTVTSVPDVLTWAWPSDVSQSGNLGFWFTAPYNSLQGTFLLYGAVGELRLEVEDDQLKFVIPHNVGEIEVVVLPATNVFDGELHYISIGWDNYVHSSTHRMPVFLAVDGVEQVVNGNPGTYLDLRTGRPCYDAAQSNPAVDTWTSIPAAIKFGSANTFVHVENPFFSTRPTLSSELVESIFLTNGPLLCSGTMTPSSPVSNTQMKRVGAYSTLNQTLIVLEPNVLTESELVVMDGVSQDKTASDYSVDYTAGEVTLSTPMNAGVKYFVMYQVAL
jgi:hypothetical protein